MAAPDLKPDPSLLQPTLAPTAESFASPEARAQALKARVTSLVQEGFSPDEIRTTLAEVEAGSIQSTAITGVSTGLKDALAAASPILAEALPSAALPGATPEAFPSSPAESAEAPLESDPFSKAAILRINDIYNIAPRQDLAEYLDDEEYATYKHNLEQRAKEFKPERVPLAQQFVCSLPTLPEAKRKPYVDAWSYHLTSNDLRPAQYHTPLHPEYMGTTRAKDKLSFLRTSEVPASWSGTSPRTEPFFDFIHKLDLLTYGSLNHLLSYAMVRLFRKGLLADFKFGSPPETGDQGFANALRVDDNGFLNMAGLNGQEVVVSAPIDGSWHYETLTPETKALLFAETRAIYQEMLPSINCFKGIENKCGSVKMWTPLNLMRDNVEISGLREDPQGRMVCNTTAKSATSTTKGVTAISKLWYEKGSEEGEKLRQIGILASKIFGGRDHFVPGARYHNENTGQYDLNRLDAILADNIPESEAYPPATLPLLSLLSNVITSYAPNLRPPTQPDEWMRMERDIENSPQCLKLIETLARIKTLKGDLADESKWKKQTGLFNIAKKAPDRPAAESELAEQRELLKKLLGEFYHYMNTQSPFTRFLSRSGERLIIPTITEESDPLALVSDLIKSVKANHEAPNNTNVATIKKYIAVFNQLVAELQEARAAGVKINESIMDGFDLSRHYQVLAPEVKKALGLE